MKTVLSTRNAPARHWVGDGFPVHGLFDYGAGATERSPFLLLDYAAPTRFEPTAVRRGVGQHPHRGFETVTLVYRGEVEHHDSTGQGGVIGPGDVQWMTAGAGILHEEFHSAAYARTGGPFEMVQLWVNLPASHKMVAPGYQALLNADIPTRPLPDIAASADSADSADSAASAAASPAGQVRVVAGQWGATAGAARTCTPMNVWDLRVQAGRSVALDQPEGWTCLLLVQEGSVQVNGQAVLRAADMATLSAAGRGVQVHALGQTDAKLLLLAGQPINEPVVGHGPFVMNSRDEIVQAMRDFNAGKFGRMPARPAQPAKPN